VGQDAKVSTDPLDVADAMFAAIESTDLDALRALYSDDFVAWTNVAGESDVDATMKVLGWLTSRLSDIRYDVARRQSLPDGFLQEHVLRGTAPDGTAIAMAACVIATVTDDGRVSRIHEYLDPGGVAALSR
jgi:ketosteroid isomerase-like protein